MLGAFAWLLGQKGPPRQVVYAFQWRQDGWQAVANGVPCQGAAAAGVGDEEQQEQQTQHAEQLVAAGAVR